MRIGDNFAFHIRPPFPDPARAGRQAITSAYCLTAEAREVCIAILRRLSSPPESRAGALIFGGYHGAGKTHLVRYLISLLENPEDPAWAGLLPNLLPADRPAQPLSGLYLVAPPDSSVDLAAFIIEELRGRGDALTSEPVPLRRLELGDFASGLAKLIMLPPAPPSLVVLDNVSRRLCNITDPEPLAREYRVLETLVRQCSDMGALVILVAEEGDLRRDMPGGERGRPGPSGRSSWEAVRLRRINVAQVIAGALASKDEHQRARVLKVLRGVRERLPSLGPGLETMIDLYPIHPLVFQALFEMRARFPEFPVLQFVQIAIKAARTRPADRLVTIDWLFDYVLTDLQNQEQTRLLVGCVEEFQRVVIPRLQPQIQERALMLLKAIALLTVCDLRPATVSVLADALLLYDDSGQLPSYAMAAAILAEMEFHGGGYLTAEGSLRERRYRLAKNARPAAPEREFMEPAEFRLQVPLMLFDWFQYQFASWKPEATAKYQHSSQSLPVTAKGAGGTARGLIHFKSYFDALWTTADLAALGNADYEWILLVLTPFERFYELDPHLRDLASRSPRLLIWRPDSPAPAETAQLQELAGLRLFGPAEEIQLTPEHAEARNAIRRVFTELYVRRGRFISQTAQCFVRDQIGGRTLEELVTLRVASMASQGTADTRTSRSKAKPEEAAQREERDHALEWAAMLCGSESIRRLSPEQARNQLIEWWATHAGMDSPNLMASGSALPEALLTTGFSREFKSFSRTLEKLELLFEHLNRGETSLAAAMTQVVAIFNRDRTQIYRWRRMLEGLPGLLRWAPSFENARAYLQGASPTNQARLETLRMELLSLIGEPMRFLEAPLRDTFDRTYRAFKEGYADYYCGMHEKILHLVEKPGEGRPAVDSVALRNLEMLSGLAYTNTSHLNRVRVIANWIRANQCELPVREILERMPRCYCNFDPTEGRHLGDFTAQINGVIRDGIEYFRSILRSCRTTVIQELKNRGIDDLHSKQVAALLSQGAMMPLKSRSIEILNDVIQKHTPEFVAAIRRHS